ncbi:hypothetical protein BASA61_001668 [Batrachochytrium salamandrivorans]|nr:hypothetical protein BASA61_001668 [Batrachochytrium salamandrivorans]KAH9268547.1 hypothetical protein BASA84_000152 [Batrachochytrium salamandrivorans]
MFVSIALLLTVSSLVTATPVSSKPKCHAKSVPEPVVVKPAKPAKPLPSPAKMRPFYQDNKPSEHSVCHWYDGTRGNDSIIIAGMRLTASVPSVNMNNVPGLNDIKCVGDKVSASFDTLAETEGWSVEPTLLIIPGRFKCGPKNAAEFALLFTEAWVVNISTNTIVFKTADPKASGVTGKYEILASSAVDSRQDGYVAPPEHVKPRRVYKRDMSESELEHHELVKRIFHFDNSYHLPLNIDMGISKTVQLPIADVGMLTTGCEPCGIHGESVATFRAFGGLFETPGVSFNWEGHVSVFANMLFNLDIKKNIETGEVTLVELPITAINVPGILVVGPNLMLNARADVAILANVNVHANFSASLPHFRAFLSSSEPKIVTGFTPVYDLTTDASLDIDAHVKLALIPKIALSAKVFGAEILRTSLSLDSTADLKVGLHARAGVIVKSVPNKPTAPSTDGGIGVAGCINMSVDAKLVGEIFGIKKDLVTIPRKTIIDKCFSAKKRIPQPTLRRLPTSTGIPSRARQTFTRVSRA